MSDYVVIIEAYKTFTGTPLKIEQRVMNIKAENGKSLVEQISEAKCHMFIYGHQPDYTLVKQVIEMKKEPSLEKKSFWDKLTSHP